MKDEQPCIGVCGSMFSNVGDTTWIPCLEQGYIFLTYYSPIQFE